MPYNTPDTVIDIIPNAIFFLYMCIYTTENVDSFDIRKHVPYTCTYVYTTKILFCVDDGEFHSNSFLVSSIMTMTTTTTPMSSLIYERHSPIANWTEIKSKNIPEYACILVRECTKELMMNEKENS